MKVLLTLHVAAAIFLVGPVIGGGMTGLRAVRTGDAAAARLTARMTMVYSWASLLVALLGAAMVQGREHAWHFSYADNWIRVSLLLYVVALVVSIGVVVPAFGAAAKHIDAGEQLGRVRVRAVVGAVTVNLLYLAIIVLMVYRP